MRKDVKLGFAIGGVLLAVLIVYVVAISGSSKKQVAQDDGQTQATADGKVTLEPDEPAGGAKTPPVPPPAPAAQFTPPGGKTDPFEGDKAAADTKPAEVANSSSPRKSDDWNKILNDQLMLMTETPQVPAVARAATPTAATPAVAVTPAAEPVSPPAPTVTAPAPAEAPAADIAAAPPTVQPIDPAPLAPTAVTNTLPAPDAGGVAPAGGRVHVVQIGETLSSISMAAYGNPNFYPHIQRANPTLDPNRLKPGMKITLPDVATVKPPAVAAAQPVTASHASAAAAPLDPAKQYRVQPGDSLHKIAQSLYGTSTNADKIYQLNKSMIGEDPHRLKVGQVLELPAPPAAGTAAAR